MVEPERAFMDEKDVEWRHGGARVYLVSTYLRSILQFSLALTFCPQRFGGPPDYTIANLYYLKACDRPLGEVPTVEVIV